MNTEKSTVVRAMNEYAVRMGWATKPVSEQAATQLLAAIGKTCLTPHEAIWAYYKGINYLVQLQKRMDLADKQKQQMRLALNRNVISDTMQVWAQNLANACGDINRVVHIIKCDAAVATGGEINK